jgi:hypothetical protein
MVHEEADVISLESLLTTSAPAELRGLRGLDDGCVAAAVDVMGGAAAVGSGASVLKAAHHLATRRRRC